ncbi:MAG TPA: ATP-binding cassette domain-containing protein [Methylomirabilota bacterium]|nr:ATP-binding cassette domain-containing protein [Methylomirabilota bacterium]
MTAAIEARGLTKRFGQTTAVDGVDLEIAPGELFGIVGPNGAGKTTLLLMLAALVDPTAGQARIDDRDVARSGPAARERLGYVSQDFTLYGTLSVEENLDFFADLYGVPASARAERKAGLLTWSRLEPFRTRRAAALSGGMQKKLHLCCSLIHEPAVLLLDEPTTGVDPVSRRELWEILHGLVGRGLTLVVTTPYMDEAERCGRVALMDRGRILRHDRPAALKAGVAEAVWRVRAPDLASARTRLAAPPAFQVRLAGDALHVITPSAPDVEGDIRRRLGGAVVDIRRVPPTMEDVFVLTVGDRARRPPAMATGPTAPPRSAGPAVRLEALTRRFGDFVAVDGISLSVDRGEIFGFLGPNGSGKTTTIRMLCGVLPPSSGRGEVLGHDVRRPGRRVKARIGYMSQRFSLYQDLTVGENLAFFGRGYGLPAGRLAERVAWALELAGLGGEERRLARELSGGVKQRLALGCALLHDPEVLFLDEPTAGVDPVARRQFWDIIVALASSGTTAFVTTHYLDEAEHCHRLGLMYQGRLIAEGSPRQLKERMRAGVMVEVACADPLRALGLIRAEPALGRVSLFGDRLHVLVDDPNAAMPSLRTALREAGLIVERLETVPLTLEDVFVIFVEMEEARLRTAGG